MNSGYKPREFARISKRGKSTIYELCQKGKLETFKIGRRLFIKKESGDAWLEKNSEAAIFNEPDYTVDQVIEMTGIGRSTLYILLKKGQLESVKYKGRRYILKSQYEQWANNLKEYL